MVLSYRYKLMPTRAQHAALREVLEDQRQLYNAALQERIDAYRKARDVNDAGWTTLRDFLRYKAKRAGAHFVEVDPKFTSQECSSCGARAPKPLAMRTHSCQCGFTADRDVNAARVILGRAVAGPGARNVAGRGERALGNLAEEMMRDATSGQEMTGFCGADLIGGRS